jgi:transcriptional regulator with XRE-family HTH domain
MSTFYKNFIAICKSRGISPSIAAEECGFSRSAVTRWKSGTDPRDTVLCSLADYFNVPVELLTQEGAFDNGVPDAAPPIEWAQDEVEAGARAARRCQIIDRTAGMTLAQLEQVLGLLDVMFPEEG